VKGVCDTGRSPLSAVVPSRLISLSSWYSPDNFKIFGSISSSAETCPADEGILILWRAGDLWVL
jgi:hypothetical protein